MRRSKGGFRRIGNLGRYGRGRSRRSLGARIHFNSIRHAFIRRHQIERQERQQGNRGVKENFVTNHSCFEASKILRQGNASSKDF